MLRPDVSNERLGREAELADWLRMIEQSTEASIPRRQASEMLQRLEAPSRDTRYMSTLGEVELARVLVDSGCTLELEVTTPSGRTCDFKVMREDRECYLHVKNFVTKTPGSGQLLISNRLRYLEQIRQPYVVAIDWDPSLQDRQMQEYVSLCSEFIQHASVGDEFIARDREGHELGSCRIMAKWDGNCITLAIGVSRAFEGQVQRVQSLLKKAYAQFMPSSDNIIVICSAGQGDNMIIDNALLGSHVERWDRIPPRGSRVAHGRSDDGFWSESRYSQSAMVAWVNIDPEAGPTRRRLWIRPGFEPAPGLEAMLKKSLDIHDRSVITPDHRM